MFPKLHDFAGHWRLQRTIMHEDASDAQFDGALEFQPQGDDLLYHETGWLRIAGQAPMFAERRFIWRNGDDGAVAVFFEDGRPFHTFSATASTDTHFCPPDTYQVTYDFASWPAWRSVWTVKGPRKAYTMRSKFWRDVN